MTSLWKRLSIFFCKNCDLKTSARPFCACKRLSTISILVNENYKASYLYETCNSKTIKICPNQHADLLRFHFTEDSLRINLHFSIFCFIFGQILLPECIYFPRYSAKCVSRFMPRHLITSWHLNITWKVKIWLSKEWKELLKRNKKYFSLFLKCFLLEILNKLAKM